MVFQIQRDSGRRQSAVASVAAKLGIDRVTLRIWVRQAEIESGQRPGTSTVDAQRLAELERENPELCRANDRVFKAMLADAGPAVLAGGRPAYLRRSA